MKRAILVILVCMFAFSGVAYANLIDGLVAYYPFNGNANDESGNANHGTVNGPTLTSAGFGNLGSAYFFDGIDDYVEIPNSPSLNPIDEITMAAWIYWEGPRYGTLATYDAQRIISKRGTGTYNSESYALWIDGAGGSEDIDEKNRGNIAIRFDAAYTPYHRQITFDYSLNESQWYHLAATYDGSLTRLFINGQEIMETAFTEDGREHFSGPISPSDHSLLIGDWYRTGDQADRHFNGIIDDIRIYDRALLETETQELASIAHSPEPTTMLLVGSGLIGLVRFRRKFRS
jgi:hypothetical protein